MNNLDNLKVGKALRERIIMCAVRYYDYFYTFKEYSKEDSAALENSVKAYTRYLEANPITAVANPSFSIDTKDRK